MAKKEVKELSSTKQKNKTVSEELLSSVRGALYKLKDYLDNIDFTVEDGEDSSKKAASIISICEKLGKAIETLVVLEKKVQSEEDLKGKARGNIKIGIFEDGD
jgi:DNA repair ATPase RecN